MRASPITHRTHGLRRWRRCAALLLCALCACQARGERVAPVTPAAGTGPAQTQALRLLPYDADVFAYALDVRVEGAATASLRDCELLLAGRTIPLGPSRSAHIALHAGLHTVQARCRAADGRRWDAPVARYTVRLPALPHVSATVSVAQGKLQLEGHAERAHALAPEIAAYTWYAVEGAPAYDRLTPLGVGPQLTLPVPETAGDQVYALRVRDQQGATSTAYTVLRGGRDAQRAKQPGELPNWVPGGVLYGVYPPLYGSHGLAALREALPDLQELGVSALWLAPVFVSPAGDYGYAVSDGFHVREDYGSDASLLELVADAHRLGLRIVLDLVPNHTSARHPYFVEAEARGTASHYFSFYDRDAEGRPTHYFDWTHLPNLNYANPEVRALSVAWAEHWLRFAAVDGYRVDAAWGIQQRAPDFWPRFSQQIAEVRPELFLLAEASARDGDYVRSGFHAAYDWTRELGHHAWEHVFDEQAGIAQRLHRALLDEVATPVDRVLRFLNNNDTGPRFITRHGEPLTRVATSALLTLPGIPCLFAFDEHGAEYEPYRAPAPVTTRNAGLRAFHQRLIERRRALPALQGAQFEALHVGQHDEAYVFVRGAGNAAVLVALNFSAQPVTLQVALPRGFGTGTGVLRDGLGAGVLRARGRDRHVRLELAAWATQLWVGEQASGGAGHEPP